MNDEHQVFYTVKQFDVNTPTLHGLVVEKRSTFDTFIEAVKFAREIRGNSRNGFTVVGKPLVVRA